MQTGFDFNYNRRLHLEEILTIFTALFINLLIIFFININEVLPIFLLNIGIAVFIAAIYFFYRICLSKGFSIFRDWYVIALLIAIYMEHRYLIPLINPFNVDKILIRIDRFIFLSNDPTVFLERFTFPLITEFLQIVYVSFYFFPATLCVLCYRKSRKTDFHIIASTIMLGFYVSYAGYYLMPAIGPRFTLEHLQSFPLKGLFIFDFLRNNLANIEGVTSDCCPSGHALISLLTFMLSRRFCKSFFPIALAWSALQIVSAVYLRYHYVTDIILAFLLALPVYYCGLALSKRYISYI